MFIEILLSYNKMLSYDEDIPPPIYFKYRELDTEETKNINTNRQEIDLEAAKEIKTTKKENIIVRVIRKKYVCFILWGFVSLSIVTFISNILNKVDNQILSNYINSFFDKVTELNSTQHIKKQN